MHIDLECPDVRLTDLQLMAYKSLFKWILSRTANQDPAKRVRGNMIISFDGQGGFSKNVKMEGFHDVVVEPVNGNGGRKI